MKNVEKKQELLLSNLSRYLKKESKDIKLEKNENGKPYTKGIYFSVSHSHEYLIHAFSKTTEIGVDIEKINNKRNYLRLAGRYFHPEESSLLNSLDEQKSRDLFYQLWTAKEALCKAEGGRLWFYLEKKCLGNNGQIKKKVNQKHISHINELQDYALSVTATKDQQKIEMVYE